MQSAKRSLPSPAPSTSMHVSPVLSTELFCRHLFLLHDALRASVDRVVTDVNALTSLAPDAHLQDLRRRVDHLAETMHAHCSVEDSIVLPQLQMSLRSCGLPSTKRFDSSQPPMKRPRNSSPVSINLHAVQSDHVTLQTAFNSLQDHLGRLRATPILPDTESGLAVSSSSSTSYEPCCPLPGSNGQFTRRDGIAHVRDAASALACTVRNHFENEELNIFPACTQLLDADQRCALLVRVVKAVVSQRILVNALLLVSDKDLESLFSAISLYASDDDVKRVAFAVAEVLSPNRWSILSSKVPTLQIMVVPKQDPLVGILHMHKAIRKELQDILSYCESLDPSHFKQMGTLAKRFHFLRRVHSCHAAGENAVLLKELQARLYSVRLFDAANELHEEHDDEEALFANFAEKQAELGMEARRVAGNAPAIRRLKQNLVKCARGIADHISKHMDSEEKNLLPMVRKHFTVDEQHSMMRSVIALVPAELVQELIPWVFNALDVNEQESMLRNLLLTTPRDEIRKVVGSIAMSVKKGLTERAEWREICLRIPEIEEDYEAIVDKDQDDGPVSEILRVHKVFRIELNALMRKSKEIHADGTIPNPRTLVSLAQGLAFVRKMVMDHSEAEDNIILPRLEERAPGISNMYHADHCDERKLFQDLAQCLQDLQCVADEDECCGLILKLHGLAQTLRDEMVLHLEKEEQHMWPVLKQLFTVDEQSEIVASIFGQMPAGRLRELLPWMIRILSVSEGNMMMNHILQVTQSTLFEKWLKTWLPLDDNSEKGNEDMQKEENGVSSSTTNGCSSSDVRSVDIGNVDGASTALAMLNGRERIEQTIRALARDSNLDVETRTRMMQQVMLAPYNQVRENALLAERDCRNDDRSKTYGETRDGVKRLGCRHYLRACKLRAACCGKLYTCRLCHDDAEQTHIMDRYATKEMLCLRCDTLQPVSGKCVNKNCGISFARYYCEVCKFFDDKENRKIYHCHSCNVCRAGDGLGKDFFHCMKCNQCMSMKYRNCGHRCVERAMESDCPVCHQYLFMSTQPVKYLSCGHLMHHACYNTFVQKDGVRCPICLRSLDMMKSVFEMIDEQISAGGALAMPSQYRTVRCNIFCLDCNKRSNQSYHFVFNKCSLCLSYNTRVEHIDANGVDPVVGSSSMNR